jgi:large subunit ribosomal protein L17
MRHRRKTKYFSRKSKPRKALLKGLVTALVEHGRIKTTVAKAKELRRHVERAITMGKKGDLNSRRLLLATYPNQDLVQTIVGDLSVRFKERPGGYTRVLKLTNRPGDNAPQAFIEFVDYDAEAYAKKTYKVRVKGADRKLVTKELNRKDLEKHYTKVNAKVAAEKVKTLRKAKGEARRVFRANVK